MFELALAIALGIILVPVVLLGLWSALTILPIAIFFILLAAGLGPGPAALLFVAWLAWVIGEHVITKRTHILPLPLRDWVWRHKEAAALNRHLHCCSICGQGPGTSPSKPVALYRKDGGETLIDGTAENLVALCPEHGAALKAEIEKAKIAALATSGRAR
jgi:hypothetical protein